MTINKESKVKLITHTDLDGVGCAILGELAFGDNINVEYADYHNVNDIITNFLDADTHIFYDKVFITDISMNKEVAERIDSLPEDIKCKFILLDHHKTANWLNDYKWATVSVDGKLGLESGTNLFFEYLVMEGFFIKERYRDALSLFVEKVRRYDCWEWKTKYNDTESLKLNNLLWMFGREKFVTDMLDKLLKTDPLVVSEGSWLEMFNDIDKAILHLDEEKANAYIYKKNRQLRKVSFGGNYVGVVFAEQYVSQLGNDLSELNPDCDYIAIIDMGNKKVSLRTVHNTIHLGEEVASKFGGGGHQKASGFEFNENVVSIFLTLLFHSSKDMIKKVDNLIWGKGFFGKMATMFSKTK